MSAAERQRLRRTILRAGEGSKKFVRAAGPGLAPAQKRALTEDAATLGRLTEYAPSWVLVVVALSLGIGTMVGWRRIVVTVGERIGKAHLTYAQGAAAELVAMSTIGLSAFVGAPVSTTHVLSSGIAGSMSVTKAGLQMATVKKIGLAWLLTLPASMALAGGLFVVLRWIFQ
jgi:PiT family inorganic phosphate transporter